MKIAKEKKTQQLQLSIFLDARERTKVANQRWAQIVYYSLEMKKIALGKDVLSNHLISL